MFRKCNAKGMKLCHIQHREIVLEQTISMNTQLKMQIRRKGNHTSHKNPQNHLTRLNFQGDKIIWYRLYNVK